jgi:hypothetical protein
MGELQVRSAWGAVALHWTPGELAATSSHSHSLSFAIRSMQKLRVWHPRDRQGFKNRYSSGFQNRQNRSGLLMFSSGLSKTLV